eukprot:scaffold63482_cov44-Phaeocystis_antarctica.AAC.2
MVAATVAEGLPMLDHCRGALIIIRGGGGGGGGGGHEAACKLGEECRAAPCSLEDDHGRLWLRKRRVDSIDARGDLGGRHRRRRARPQVLEERVPVVAGRWRVVEVAQELGRRREVAVEAEQVRTEGRGLLAEAHLA